MCDPASVMIGTYAVNSVVQGFAKKDQADADAKFYNYKAGLNDLQAKAIEDTAESQKHLNIDAAARTDKQLHDQGNQVAGAQRAGLAARGVSLGSATAEDLARDSLNKEIEDENTVRYQADLKNWEVTRTSQLQAWDQREQAKMNRTAASNSEKAGKYAMIGSLLGGASQVAGTYYSGKK